MSILELMQSTGYTDKALFCKLHEYRTEKDHRFPNGLAELIAIIGNKKRNRETTV